MSTHINQVIEVFPEEHSPLLLLTLSCCDTKLPEKYMLYAGALQPWQGVDVLLKSLRYLEDVDLPLVICSSYTETSSS